MLSNRSSKGKSVLLRAQVVLGIKIIRQEVTGLTINKSYLMQNALFYRFKR